MNRYFDIIKFFQEIESVDLERNIQSLDRRKLAEEYLNSYPFVKKDSVFVDFIRNINGVQYGGANFFFIIYGFGFPEDEIIFTISQYMNNNGFLMLGEYIDKGSSENWRNIVYAYNRLDKSPVVYAKFSLEDIPEVKDKYYPLCVGFQELVEIVMNKGFDEQFKMAYTPDYPI